MQTFGFQDGVYDLKEKRFRKPKPAEYVCHTVGYDYIELNEEVKEARDFIYQTLLETQYSEDCLKWLLMSISQCLAGVGHKEQFYWGTDLMGRVRSPIS